LSVIMPGYNEGERVLHNLLQTAKELEQFASDFEIVFVDDGSTDNTCEQAAAAALQDARIKVLQSKTNCGKGSALRLGTKEAIGEYIAFLDADLDLPAYQLQYFLSALKEQDADVAIGCKQHKDSKVEYPFSRRFISFGYYLLLLVLFRLNVHDTQTGIKLFKAKTIKPVMQIILAKRFAFDIEVLAICNRHKKKIIELPVTLVYGRSNKWGRIRLKDIFVTAWDTAAIFYRLKILKYYDKQGELFNDK
ncbi:MAG: glycosyltransferase family 2 protein, partial [Christensenella sp.]